MKNLQEAVAKLTSFGLVAEIVVDRGKSFILGGTSRTNELGINVYQNTFHIVPRFDGWDITVTGAGHSDITERTQTLVDALLAVKRILHANKHR